MAFDSTHQRKPLYADLFKSPNKNAAAVSRIENSVNCSSSSSWTQSLLSCDSSSSGFSTPLYSDLGSSGSENGDFIDELSRQMAECMLQEEDEEGSGKNSAREDCQASYQTKDSSKASFDDRLSPIQASNQKKDNNNSSGGLNSSFDDGVSQIQPIQACEVKNQPPVRKPGRRRRVKRTDQAQAQAQAHKKQVHKTVKELGFGHTGNGSGMQAFYLGHGGSGYGSGSTGTGVFLPRVTREFESVSRDSGQVRKKPGHPIILIPTRVLEVLDHHFDRVQNFNSTCPKDESWRRANGGRDLGESQEETASSNHEGMMAQLPKEWTY